jgi:hypothetical protein
MPVTAMPDKPLSPYTPPFIGETAVCLWLILAGIKTDNHEQNQ